MATIYADSASYTDVNTAYGLCSVEDTLIVLAGEETWSSVLEVTIKITLRGMGINSTIITKTDEIIDLNQSGSRITGFEFIDGHVTVDGDGWRVDNCKFYRESVFSVGINVRGNRENYHPTGLIDNCVFHNKRVLVVGWAGLLAHGLWVLPLNLGLADNRFFVENCTFTATVSPANAIDGSYGGRFVFRHNIVNDMYIEAHSVQGNHRAIRSWEIYENIINQVSENIYMPFRLRGGTGVVFNNTLTGTWGDANIGLDNVRDYTDSPTSGYCDGLSDWDENTVGEAGWACRDQIGRGEDDSLWEPGNEYPSQSSEPAYAWNNFIGATPVEFKPILEAATPHIVEDRDFFNTEKTGYNSYDYPHPLGASIVFEQDVQLRF